MAVEMLVEPKAVFQDTFADKGEGFMIAMKLALQAFVDRKPLLVFSRGSHSENAGHLNFTSFVSENPLAAARGLSRAAGRQVLVFAGDVVTAQHLASFRNVQENISYICLNNAGSSSSGSRYGVEKRLSGSVSARYVATASVAFPEDFMKKLLRAKSAAGFAFLEVHCPSPKLWGFDPSNTIEVGRAAVNSNAWPLVEISGDSASPSYRPEQLEPVEAYVKMQSRFAEADVKILRAIVAENAKLMA